MSVVYIGIGSNIGDRVGYVQQAYRLLNDIDKIDIKKSSSLYETEPYGYKEQNWFINAVIQVETNLEPLKLLMECQRIEKQLGRIKHPDAPQWGPRTLDLDILFYDNMIISSDRLMIPHPGVDQRACVLVPLLEIAPDFVHPTLNTSISEIYETLCDPEEVCLYGTRIINE